MSLVLMSTLACASERGHRASSLHRPSVATARGEISHQWQQIRELTQGLAVSPEAQHRGPVCERPTPQLTPEHCHDSCAIADAVSDLARDLCQRAGALGDDWSLDKCASANRRNKDARHGCCVCAGPRAPSRLYVL